MMWFKVLILTTFIYREISALNLDSLSLDDILDLLIPTVKSTNLKCRNHSLFYREELKKMKLWATEMFDASSKFPSGVLFGSTYDFGNFDECINVQVPWNEEKFVGKYCMAKFHITPPQLKDHKQFLQSYNNEKYVNASTWQKIVDFADDRSRSSRSDFYFSFCVPSSCRHNDLEYSLKELTEKLNSRANFKVTVAVNSLNCQVKDEHHLDIADISFIAIVILFLFISLMATTYDWLIKLDGLKKLKLDGKKHDLIISFSIRTNSLKLCKEGSNDDGLQCINGLKVVSMFLIIMGHRIMFAIGSPIINPNFVEDLYGRVETSGLLNGPIIVNTFFSISGFLVSYLLLLQFEKAKNGINVFHLYIHRFIRLTPSYAIVLAFYATIFVKIGSGPFWLERVQVEQDRCIASWWANLLYINNYINKDNICMFQSWYLTCDTHFYLVAPFIIWLLKKKPFLGLGILFAIIVISISIVFWTVYVNNENAILLLYMSFLKDPVVSSTFKNVYIPTHMRASPYFVGMITGYIKYQIRKKQYKMPKYMVYMGWIMCWFIMQGTMYSGFVFYIPEKPYDAIMSGTYAAIHHVTWSVGISWMIIAMSEGRGAWLEPVFSWKPLVLLSRITYTAFLCHGAIQIYTAAVLRAPNYASYFNLVFYTAGDITLAYVIGWIISMLFEAPILQIEKILIGNHEKEEKKTVMTVMVTPKNNTVDRF